MKRNIGTLYPKILKYLLYDVMRLGGIAKHPESMPVQHTVVPIEDDAVGFSISFLQ